jgi:hypothetical protein
LIGLQNVQWSSLSSREKHVPLWPVDKEWIWSRRTSLLKC